MLVENLIYNIDKLIVVHSFDKSEKGFQYLQTHNPDLVILDLQMPKITGLEILENIKKRLLIPVFIISSDSKMTTVEKVFTLGADEYFSKPLDIKKLREKLRQTLFASSIYF